MTLKQRIKIEKAIAKKIVVDALALNYFVSVNDSCEWTVNKSQDQKTILKALMTTDDDLLAFHNKDGKYIGVVWLVYGNDGYDVICDYTANKGIEGLLAGANTLADKYNEEYWDTVSIRTK